MTKLILFTQPGYEMLHLGKLLDCVSMAGGILQSSQFDNDQSYFIVTISGVPFKDISECAKGLDISSLNT